MEAATVFALLVAGAHQRLDQQGIFAIAQGFCVKAEVDVEGAHVGRVRVVEQQPRHSAADDGELALVAAEDLADLQQDLFDGRSRAVIVVAGHLGFGHRGHSSPDSRR